MRVRSGSSQLRAAAQCAKLAEEARASVASLGLSVQQLARLSGASWWTAKRVLEGDPSASVQTLAAVLEAAGLDLVLRAYPGDALTLRDSGQLEVAQQLCSVAAAAWQPAVELNVGPHGEAIDLCFFGPTEILACEIERRLTDWQAQFRRADTKRQALASRHQRPVRLVMVLEDARRSRAAIEPHLPLIRTALPAGSREVMRALRTGSPLGRDGIVWVRRGTPSRSSTKASP